MAIHDLWLTEFDLHLLGQGTHYRSWDKLGAHLRTVDGVPGVHFAVWAPNARYVSVVGDFNQWNVDSDPLYCRTEGGIWEGFIPRVAIGNSYKFFIRSNYNGFEAMKVDPYAFYAEKAPRSASIVWDISRHQWNDHDWMSSRRAKNAHDAPISIYELHLASWMRGGEYGEHPLSYRDLADKLAEYVSDMGFTHVELLPITEHPFDGSWGYQSIGYFAPTSRFGTPEDFKYFVDRLHQAGIGVLVDWVPAHFPSDGHGLAYYDGSHLYEHADPRQGFHPDWGSLIFNFGRNEVSNFLISSALFWLEEYHIDGLRVDAVASMIYLDYSRKEGEWIPNQYGGRENLEALSFLRRLNETVYREHPDVMMVAEESTAWPMVSRPTYVGGLGFGYKWNMGWMNDVLSYMSKDPVHRSYHHGNLSFGLLYAFHENFILPLSHDEVVHHKGSLLDKMPGDSWQKFANLRLLFGFMYAHPGKKLLFMGGEFGQGPEWNNNVSLDWHVLEYDCHKGIQRWVKDLNHFFRAEGALHEVDFSFEGFSWIDCHDDRHSVLSFVRYGRGGTAPVICVCNFTPVPRTDYRLGVPRGGYWEEVLNSDAEYYWGSGIGNLGGVLAEDIPSHGQPQSVSLKLPPLGALFLRAT